jgi:hypothetical protein
VARKIFLHLYMLRVPMMILLLLSLALPAAFGTSMFISAFNDVEEHEQHCRSLEIRRRPHYCVSRCVSRRQLSTWRSQRLKPAATNCDRRLLACRS